MIKKFDVITKLYEEATQEVTESPEKWLAFLQSASKNYRLPFDEQLLIHVQRPEATAVLPMEKWNEKFGRWVKRDSKGIAVFDKSSNHLKLKSLMCTCSNLYAFQISTFNLVVNGMAFIG